MPVSWTLLDWVRTAAIADAAPVPRCWRNERAASAWRRAAPARRQTAAIMVNAELTSPCPRRGAARCTSRRPAIDFRGIDQPVRIDECQPRHALAGVNLAIKTRATAGVAGRVLLLDAEPDRILITIQAYLDHALGVT